MGLGGHFGGEFDGAGVGFWDFGEGFVVSAAACAEAFAIESLFGAVDLG